jgi:hypothetical protein
MAAYAAESVVPPFGSTADARQFLERRLEELRARLQNSEREFVDYARANDIVALATATDEAGRTRAERTLVGDTLAAFQHGAFAGHGRADCRAEPARPDHR